MKTQNLLFCLIFSLLAGCQSIPASYETPYDNPHVLPPPGTVIELHQSLAFVPNNSRSNIQNGKAIGASRYDRFQPRCQFYLYESQDVMKKARTIEPDRFTVTKSFQKVIFASAKSLEVAYVSVGVPIYGGPFDDSVGSRTMRTTMRLHSDKQPQVYELRCMKDDDPYLQSWVTINQMIKTLGEVATLKIPELTQ